MYLSDDGRLRDLCETARADGRIGLDTEFIRDRSYYAQLALLQISAGEEMVLVDPLTDIDLSPVESLFADESVTKVLHAPTQDLEIFFHRTGETPRNIFDTQVAAAMLGIGSQISYGGLVQSVLGTHLKKGESFTDWLRRPLSSKQEQYAIDDVRYLFPLHDALQSRLDELGRGDWLTEELLRYEESSLYTPPEETLYTKVKRFNTLSARGKGVLRELAIWRESEARRRDRPRRSVVHDEVLVEIARTQPKSPGDLDRVRGLHSRERDRSGSAMITAIERGLAIPDDELPRSTSRKPLDDEAQLVVEFLGAFLKAECKGADISPNMVTNSAGIQELVRQFFAGGLEGSQLPILQGWRRELIGDELVGFLRGEVSVHLDPDKGRPVFERR